MRIQAVLPFADLEDLLIAMSVLLVVVRPRRIIDIIPVLHDSLRLAVLTLLPPAALPLLAHVIPDIIIFRSGPVGQGALHGRHSWRRPLACAWDQRSLG